MILGIASTITQLPEEALLEVFGRSVASPYMFIATVSWDGLVDVQLGSETFEASMKFNAEKRIILVRPCFEGIPLIDCQPSMKKNQLGSRML